MAFPQFPEIVNEKAARTTAGLVVIAALIVLVTGHGWAWWLLAAGFALRVLSGPHLSPLAILGAKVIAPRLGAPTLVSGPPKRFAQAIGLVVSLAAAIAWTFDAPVVAAVFGGVLIFAAGLESIAGFCLGCAIFGFLQRRRILPRSVCESCDDISARLAERAAQNASAARAP